jgi:Tfp pilus assembly major pilin PilA
MMIRDYLNNRSQAVCESVKCEIGFSVVELLVVLGIIALLSAISLPYIINYKKAYKSEDQAIKVIDIMREANQLAITRRRTMRIEIDLTDNALLLIDDGSSPDMLIKKVPLESTTDVRMDACPTSIAKPNPPNYADITFATDTIGHNVGTTSVTAHNVWAARFKSDGSVTNVSDIPLSATIYVWPPASAGSAAARSSVEVRAITLFGGSGALRYWKYSGSAFVASQ